MVECGYTMQQDPLDLMSIGDDVIAYDEDRGEEDNQLSLWVKPSDLGQEDGRLDSAIVKGAITLGIDANEHIDIEVPLTKPFEGLILNVASTCITRVGTSSRAHDTLHQDLGFDDTNISDDDGDDDDEDPKLAKKNYSNATANDGGDDNGDNEGGTGLN